MVRFQKLVDTFGMGLIFLILCVFFSTQSDIFFTRLNFSNLIIHTAVNLIIAVGMTFVISAAEIDLSVGSLMALCGVIVALLLQFDYETGENFITLATSMILSPFPDIFPWACAWWLVAVTIFLVFAILPGIVGGALSGLIVVRFGVPSFIVTLGFMMMDRGLARWLTHSSQITPLPPAFTQVGSGVWFEFYGFRVSYSAAIALFIAVVGAFLLARSRFGRNVLAVGGNAQASYLSGVSVKRTKFLVFVVSGFCVAIAAIIQTSRMFMGDPNAGEGYELDAIAAVIIGGTSLFGGKGTVIGTMFGALIIGVLRNGLELMGVNDNVKLIVIGGMIIFAVLLDHYRRKLYQGKT